MNVNLRFKGTWAALAIIFLARWPGSAPSLPAVPQASAPVKNSRAQRSGTPLWPRRKESKRRAQLQSQFAPSKMNCRARKAVETYSAA